MRARSGARIDMLQCNLTAEPPETGAKGSRPMGELKKRKIAPAAIAAGTSALRRYHARRHTNPICGAKGKTSGKPCQMPPMENGRCRMHGGLTPKGDQWHLVRRQSPSKRAAAKLQAKLETLERRAKERAARLAAMTVEERAAYDKWVREHQPGPAAARAARKRTRQDAEAMRAAIERPLTRDTPPDPEMVAIVARMAELRARLAVLDLEPAQADAPGDGQELPEIFQ